MKTNRKFRRLLFLFAALMICALPLVTAFTFGPFTPRFQAQPMDINAFFQWLITGGGSILAVSWLFERMAWFQALSSGSKDNVIFFAAVVVGCGALAVVTYVPAAILAVIAPYFLIVSAVFTTIFIAKAFHKADKLG